MKRVLILAEGQTEEEFALQVLRPHLLAKSVVLHVTRIATRVRESRRTHRGGHGNSFSHIDTDIRKLLRDSNAAMVTTIIDYYGLPADFPGLTSRPTGSCYDRLRHMEASWATHVNDARFLPHLVMHEFEALLFTAPDEVQDFFDDVLCFKPLAQILEAFDSPEEINEGRDTCPSRRLRSILPQYSKRGHGPALAARIGLDRIRAACPHFNEWLCRLELLGQHVS